MSELPAASPRVLLRRMLARQALPLGLIALCIWLLRDRFAVLDLSGVLQATRAIPPGAWIAACLATLVSFHAVGRYDAVIHRLLRTGIAENPARHSGIAAIATAQTTGFGLLIGTLTRWRMLPELSLWQSARVTMAVAMSFLAGLAVTGAVMALWLGAASPLPVWIATLVLLGAVAFGAVTLWRPSCLLHLSFPPLRAQAEILALVALDTFAAAIALYVLLPPDALPPAALFYAVFLLALGAGLIGATPGGVGPFELVCLASLPGIAEAPLLAAIAGYRVVYYGLPGALAAVLLVIGPKLKHGRTVLTPSDLVNAAVPPLPGSRLDTTICRARRSEAQLVRQGEFDILARGEQPVALAAATGQSLIILGQALAPDFSDAELITLAKNAARARFLTPVFYKSPARLAAAAKRAGWRVTRVSQEAWVAPAAHDADTPACRQLRRALRKAEAAGMRAVEAGARLPLDDMSDIAAAWAKSRGGARGFSMGRFDPACILRQRVHLCFDAQRRLVAFATFHESRHESALDLMCQSRQAPPGAMHLLIASAIDAARERGCPRLSLAAAPQLASDWRWLPVALAERIDARSGATGLIRFKCAFAPKWEPLYMAAPTQAGLLLGSLDLIDRITRPGRTRPGRSNRPL